MVHRKHTKYFIQYVFDLIGLACAWYCTVLLRFLLNPYLPRQLKLREAFQSAPPMGLTLLLWVTVGLWVSIYRPRKSHAGEYSALFESGLLASVLAIIVTFFSRQFGADLSRSMAILAVPMNCAGLALARFGATAVFRLIDRRWPSPERVAVLGAGQEAEIVADKIRNSGRRVSVAGVILPKAAAAAAAAGAAGAASFGSPGAVIGNTGSLAELINFKRLDRIVVVNGATPDEVEDCGAVSKRMGVVLSRTLEMPDKNSKMEIVERFGLPLLDVRPVAFTRRQEIVKRCFDVLAACVLLLTAAPLFAIIAILIKLTSQGPVLYKSARVGRGGRHFTFLKFRSMRLNQMDRRTLVKMTGKQGHLFKLRQDPRVTPVGRFLRIYSLDELPQLVNVLRGDMSLVGPRPLPAEDLDPDGHSREFRKWSEQRSLVPPGITGLWQIRGRSDVPFDQMIELDITYIREWSLQLDLKILLKTPVVVITGKGAY